MSLIHVNLCTRERPLGLIGVIMGLNRLRSQRHDVVYRIGCDMDDEMTLSAIANLQHECDIQPIVGPKPIARGEVENRLLAGSTDADAVTMLTDRTFCITPGWDDAIARGVAEQPKRLLWWQCPEDQGCVMPIIPRAWREASGNVWSPEIFPFWFDDTWNQHIDLLIYGLPSKKIVCNYAGLRAKTKRAREFTFWIQLFNHLVPQRVGMAEEIAGKLGAEFKPRPEVLEYIQRHYQTLIDRVGVLEQHFGDNGDPDAEYVAAKQRAEQLFAKLIGGDQVAA